MHKYPTITSIVDNNIETWHPDELAFIAADGYDFGMATRAVRNEYGLWWDHPLTAKWRSGEEVVMKDGIDYSPGHPDNLSQTILEEVRKKLRLQTMSQESQDAAADLKRKVDALLSGGPEL